MAGGVSFDLNPDAFPFELVFYRITTEELLRVDVTGPGVVEVPTLGEGCRARIEFPDGTSFEVY